MDAAAFAQLCAECGQVEKRGAEGKSDCPFIYVFSAGTTFAEMLDAPNAAYFIAVAYSRLAHNNPAFKRNALVRKVLEGEHLEMFRYFVELGLFRQPSMASTLVLTALGFSIRAKEWENFFADDKCAWRELRVALAGVGLRALPYTGPLDALYDPLCSVWFRVDEDAPFDMVAIRVSCRLIKRR